MWWAITRKELTQGSQVTNIKATTYTNYINQYTARDTVGKGYGNLAANIGPISENPFTAPISNQSFVYSMDMSLSKLQELVMPSNHLILCCLLIPLPSIFPRIRVFSSKSVPGAGERHSTHDKGHEEGGSAYAKAGSSLRSPPGNSRASTPKTRVCLLSAVCSHLHL